MYRRTLGHDGWGRKSGESRGRESRAAGNVSVDWNAVREGPTCFGPRDQRRFPTAALLVRRSGGVADARVWLGKV